MRNAPIAVLEATIEAQALCERRGRMTVEDFTGSIPFVFLIVGWLAFLRRKPMAKVWASDAGTLISLPVGSYLVVRFALPQSWYPNYGDHSPGVGIVFFPLLAGWVICVIVWLLPRGNYPDYDFPAGRMIDPKTAFYLDIGMQLFFASWWPVAAKVMFGLSNRTRNRLYVVSAVLLMCSLTYQFWPSA